jgi:N-acetylglutamate synthase-like GNAT family acetyltransferase
MKARTLSPGNADQYVQIVREYGLPLTGLLTSTECFEFCDDQGTIVGFAGLQRAGTDALLRSLVVLSARQRSGFGSAIVAWVMSFASGKGILRLFALTTTN